MAKKYSIWPRVCSANKLMKVLVTGCAGFIGFHVCVSLSKFSNIKIYGIDNLNKNYDLKLKRDRLKEIYNHNDKFIFYKNCLSNNKFLIKNFSKNKYDIVIHLAAQAGVRESLKKPNSYFKNNITSFYNIIYVSSLYKIKKLIYASSSSVYGQTLKLPSKEKAITDKPDSFYAASKKTNEIIAYSFSSTYKLETIGLRFFSIFGNFGRPDMAYYKFLSKMYNGDQISLYNKGLHYRDFTHVSEVTSIIKKLIKSKKNMNAIPYDIFNIGSNKPLSIIKLVKTLENISGIKAKLKKIKLQKGDVYKTNADNKKIIKKLGYKIEKNFYNQLVDFTKWFKEYHGYE